MSDAVSVTYYGTPHAIMIPASDDTSYVNFCTGLTKMVDRKLADRLSGKPGWIVDGKTPLHFINVAHPDGGLVVMNRWGALGDLIQARAVLAAFVQLFPKYTVALECLRTYRKVFQNDPLFMKVGDTAGLDAIGTVSLEGVMEVDHTGKPEFMKHRVELLWEFLMKELNVDMIADMLDWDIPCGPEDEQWARDVLKAHNIPLSKSKRDMPVIGFQCRGSTTVKTLRLKTAQFVTRTLGESGVRIFLIEHGRQNVWGGRRIHSTPGRPVTNMIALMKHFDAAVTMDSGALWMAHAARIPTVCILGPTRPSERITLHPLYKTGQVIGIELNKLMDCNPCFERGGRCKKKFTCIRQVNQRKLLELIIDSLRRVCHGHRFDCNAE